MGRLTLSLAAMHIETIHKFIANQGYVIGILRKNFNLPDGVTGRDWANVYKQVKAKYEKNPFAKQFYIHGYGLEYEDDKVYIDFDFGSNGRYDGFDEWRIFMYVTRGKPNEVDPGRKIQNEIEDWFKTAVQNGVIYRDYPLYYLKSG